MRPRGFSLIEAAIVLGIVGLVIGGIWAAASTVNQRLKATRMVSGTFVIMDNMRRLYHGKDVSSGGNVTAEVVRAGVVPANMLNGTTPVTPWGDPMTITVASGGFTITFDVSFAGAKCRAFISEFAPRLMRDKDFIAGKTQIEIDDTEVVATDTIDFWFNQCSGPGPANDAMHLRFEP